MTEILISMWWVVVWYVFVALGVAVIWTNKDSTHPKWAERGACLFLGFFWPITVTLVGVVLVVTAPGVWLMAVIERNSDD